MEILHVLENADNTYGGPARSVPYLCSTLEKLGHKVSLRTTYKNVTEHNIVCEEKNIVIKRFRSYGPLGLRFSPGLLGSLVRYISRSKTPVLVHVHNLWNRPTFCAYISKSIFPQKVKLVISPRGSLFERSLQQKKTAKKIVGILFQKKMLAVADIIHATSQDEKLAIQKYIFSSGEQKTKIHNMQVVPNGVELDEFDSLPSQEESREYFELREDKIYMLSLGRIHAKKGFDILIDCFVKLAPRFPKLHLVIAGMKEDMKLWEESMQKLKDANLLSRSEDLGMVTGRERIYAYRAVDFFVLPSHTENFGIVIAEALACEKLVITSDNTPWQELNTLDAGYCIPLAEFEKTMEKVIEFTPVQREIMGKKGRKYVYEHFSWKELGTRYEQMYMSLENRS